MVYHLSAELFFVLNLIDINKSQEILREVAGSKSILQILGILRGVYGVMGLLEYLWQIYHYPYQMHK